MNLPSELIRGSVFPPAKGIRLAVGVTLSNFRPPTAGCEADPIS